LGVPVVALVIDELAGVAQHGRRAEPALILRGKLVKDLELLEQLEGMGAHRFSELGVDSVTPRRGQHALPALMLEFDVRGSAGILLDEHLGQDSIAQAKRRVAEPG